MELQHLTEQIVALSQQEDLLQLGRSAGEIKQQFEDLLIELERQEQVKRLNANDAGETYEEIDYKPFKEAFFEAFNQFVTKRKAQQQLQQTLEAQNLKLKKDLITRLKEVIDNEEKIGTAFQAYKEIHETWKKIGAIPREHRETIQKEYSRLLEIFFYNIKIYKELKDHDYRRNKQLKEDLIFKLKQLRVAALEQRDLEGQLHALQDSDGALRHSGRERRRGVLPGQRGMLVHDRLDAGHVWRTHDLLSFADISWRGGLTVAALFVARMRRQKHKGRQLESCRPWRTKDDGSLRVGRRAGHVGRAAQVLLQRTAAKARHSGDGHARGSQAAENQNFLGADLGLLHAGRLARRQIGFCQRHGRSEQTDGDSCGAKFAHGAPE